LNALDLTAFSAHVAALKARLRTTLETKHRSPSKGS
jgi:hypothetical protein